MARMTLSPFNETIIPTNDDLRSDNPEGGSGPLSFVGTPSQLGDIVITTDGTYDFGTRSVSSQQWWQVGDRAWGTSGEVILLEASTQDGDILTAGVNADAFDVITDITARRGTKAGESDFAYESFENHQLLGRFSVSPANTPTSTRKAIWGYTGRWTDNMKKLFSSSYSANSGPFDDGDNTEFVAGETFSGVTSPASGSTVFTGYIVKHDTVNGEVAFRVDDAYSYSSTQNNGAVITGDVSGETATFDGVVWRTPSAMKMTRSDTDPSVTPTSPEVALAFTHSSIPQLILQARTSDFGTDDDRPSPTGMTDSLWEDWMWLADYSSTDFVGVTRRAGAANSNTYSNPNSLDFSNVPYEMHHVLLFADWAGETPNETNPYGHFRSRMKDPWMDYEFAGAYLGDADTLAGCSKLVPCRSNTWGSSSANVKINWGETTGNGYLYILDDAGVWQNELAGLDLGVKP